MGINLSHAALRLVTGGFILNSGIAKLHLEKETAGWLQDTAANAIPQVKTMESEQFGKALAFAEISIGTALLLPLIPTRLAGLALGAFSGGLLATYLKTPGMTQSDGIRPTQAGTAMAKDVWMVGIAAALIFDRKRRVKVVAAKK